MFHKLDINIGYDDRRHCVLVQSSKMGHTYVHPEKEGLNADELRFRYYDKIRKIEEKSDR